MSQFCLFKRFHLKDILFHFIFLIFMSFGICIRSSSISPEILSSTGGFFDLLAKELPNADLASSLSFGFMAFFYIFSVYKIKIELNKINVLISMIFSFIFVVGLSFSSVGDLSFIFENIYQFFISLFVFWLLFNLLLVL